MGPVGLLLFALAVDEIIDFESARQYALRGVEIWRLGGVRSPVEEISAPAVLCLCYEALCEWHFGEIASCQTTMPEAISLAKELNDTHAWPWHCISLDFSATLSVSLPKSNTWQQI